MTTLVTGRIREHATRLGLTHLSETITELVTRAETNQLGYLDFIDLLLEEELGIREGRRFRNALKLSGLPHHKTLDGFDFGFQPDHAAQENGDLRGQPAQDDVGGVDHVPLTGDIAGLGRERAHVAGLRSGTYLGGTC